MKHKSLSLSYLYHETQGDINLANQDLEAAFACYKTSLLLNPINFTLLAKLAGHVHKNPSTLIFLELLESSTSNSLAFSGEAKSVFDLAKVASILNKKIMLAQQTCKPDSYGLSILLNPWIPKRRPKIVLLTCVWQRQTLTDIILGYYSDVKDKIFEDIDLILVAVGSEGDISRNLCEKYGFKYYEHPNAPLSAKWQFGLDATRLYDPDGVVIIGSDDLVTPNIFYRYAGHLQEGLLCAGLTDTYFFDLLKPEHSIHWLGYGGMQKDNGMPHRLNESIGMARLYSRTLLDLKNFKLWDGVGINSGLDGRARKAVEDLGMLPVLYDQRVKIKDLPQSIYIGQIAQRMTDLDVVAVDIKLGEENVTKLDRYKMSAESYTQLNEPWQFLSDHFPSRTVESLNQLHRKTTQVQK